MATPENKLAFDGGWEYAPAPESTDHVRIAKRYGLFIDNEFVSPENSTTAYKNEVFTRYVYMHNGLVYAMVDEGETNTVLEDLSKELEAEKAKKRAKSTPQPEATEGEGTEGEGAETKEYSGRKIMCFVSKKMVPIEDTVEVEYSEGKSYRVLNHEPVCMCTEGCSPTVSICLKDKGCPAHLACKNSECVDPCAGHSCPGATPCVVENHKANCKFCPPGYVADENYGYVTTEEAAEIEIELHRPLQRGTSFAIQPSLLLVGQSHDLGNGAIAGAVVRRVVTGCCASRLPA